MAVRSNQIERTRSAIVAAARELAETGGEITMPAVAAAARVSEATAYRHFPDLVSLLRVAVQIDDHVIGLSTTATDPVERIGAAAEALATAVLRRQGAVRVVVASTIAKPSSAAERPAHRFRLIDEALSPWIEETAVAEHPEVLQLLRDLAVVISAESVFTLTDLCRLDPDAAVTSLVATARRLTASTVAALAASVSTVPGDTR
jgi:AcrR family transcriptional regulator